MKTIQISKDEIQSRGFVTPPEHGGQIVEVSYACTEDHILVRTHDASDCSEFVVAYQWPACGAAFEPQNGAPKLGRRVGKAEII